MKDNEIVQVLIKSETPGRTVGWGDFKYVLPIVVHLRSNFVTKRRMYWGSGDIYSVELRGVFSEDTLLHVVDIDDPNVEMYCFNGAWREMKRGSQ